MRQVKSTVSRSSSRQLPSDFLCSRRQPPTLVIGETHSAVADLLSQNPILLNQIMDDMLLMLVHPAGQGDDEKGNRVQERAHYRKLSRRLLRLTPQCFQSHRVFAHYGNDDDDNRGN